MAVLFWPGRPEPLVPPNVPGLVLCILKSCIHVADDERGYGDGFFLPDHVPHYAQIHGDAVVLVFYVGYGHGHREFLLALQRRSEEHTSELQSLMRISYAVFCLKKKKAEINLQ